MIRLVFVDGIPTKEVAASFGLTYRTIDRIKRTAIEILRRCMPIPISFASDF